MNQFLIDYHRTIGGRAKLMKTIKGKIRLTVFVQNTIFVITPFFIFSLFLSVIPANATNIHGNKPPIANAGTAQTVTVGTVVHLNGSGSYDPQGQSITYKWSMQGKPSGSTATLANPTTVSPSFTADVAGNYVVSLAVTDSMGLSSSPSRVTETATSIPSPPSAPVASFTANPTSGQAPLSSQFTDSSTGTPTSWSWAFGDGTSSTAQNPSHTYNGAGTYGVTLTASNSGGSSSKSASITVNPAPPVANFTANPTSGTVPLAVQFTDSSTGTVSSCSWNFGDGATSTSQNPSHSYSVAGTFTVQLTVSNVSGSTSKTATITVNASTPPPSSRNLYWQPFSSNSPWNHPIGTGAIYTSVANLANLAIGLRTGDNWTCGIYLASTTDRQGTLYFRNDMWTLLASGITINGVHYPVYNSGNPPVVENALVAGAHDLPYKSGSSGAIWPANFYSTITPGASSPSWPSGIHQTTDNYWSTIFNIPTGAVPSPDTDGNIAICQPNGWFLDCYDAVVLSNGSIVCSIASYIDSAGSGDGYSSGRRASLLPSFAGQIRQGEITGGVIQHALVCNMSATILKEQAQWPAVCWDTNAGYSGTLPMGALLAIPQSVNINSLGLTPQGLVLARAMQNYGLYISDRGGSGGMTLLAELKATDVRWTNQSNDLNIIKKNLKWVSNNSATTPGGGGTPIVPLLP